MRGLFQRPQDEPPGAVFFLRQATYLPEGEGIFVSQSSFYGTLTFASSLSAERGGNNG
jgi:hypothetical protein